MQDSEENKRWPHLLADGGDQEAAAVAQRCDRALLLLLVQRLELVLGQGLARLRHHLDDVQDQDLPGGGDTV